MVKAGLELANWQFHRPTVNDADSNCGSLHILLWMYSNNDCSEEKECTEAYSERWTTR